MENNFKMPRLFDHAHKLIEAYHAMLTPLSKETGIPPLALDILLFIANNPQQATASQLCKVRGLKSGIVSVHMERLVLGGLLERKPIPDDRRKTMLTVTQKAMPIVEKGREIQLYFGKKLLDGVTPEQMAVWQSISQTIDSNLEQLRKNI